MIIPSWLSFARRLIGTKEKIGPEHNPVVLKFWETAQIKFRVVDDETPWCAAFVGAMLFSVGYPGTCSGMARSYSNSNLFIKIPDESPIPIGAIAVFSSPSRGKTAGHVGFVEGQTPTHLLILGGNQGNSVSVAPFPRSNLIGLFWPAKAPNHNKMPEAPYSQAAPTEVSDR